MTIPQTYLLGPDAAVGSMTLQWLTSAPLQRVSGVALLEKGLPST